MTKDFIKTTILFLQCMLVAAYGHLVNRRGSELHDSVTVDPWLSEQPTTRMCVPCLKSGSVNSVASASEQKLHKKRQNIVIATVHGPPTIGTANSTNYGIQFGIKHTFPNLVLEKTV